MLASVAERAEAIRVTIAETSDDEDTRGVVISASLGVASTEHAGYDLQQLMADADNALYRAKRGGRNRVVLDDVPQGEAASL
jgi:diguanylate cyclase (GGDEF)-like protein